MARERTQFKQTTYLSVNAQGELYATSKEPREGFELVELEDGNKFYKKVFEGTDFGFITGLGIIEKDGSQVSIQTNIQNNNTALTLEQAEKEALALGVPLEVLTR